MPRGVKVIFRGKTQPLRYNLPPADFEEGLDLLFGSPRMLLEVQGKSESRKPDTCRSGPGCASRRAVRGSVKEGGQKRIEAALPRMCKHRCFATFSTPASLAHLFSAEDSTVQYLRSSTKVIISTIPQRSSSQPYRNLYWASFHELKGS